MERAGLVMPKPQTTEHMEVVDAGFVLKPSSRIVVLSVEVEVKEPPSEANYLRVSFPDTTTRFFRETKTIALGESPHRVRSSALKDLEYLDAYPVRVQLCQDRAGKTVIEELIQNVRFEVPPSALEKMGVSL